MLLGAVMMLVPELRAQSTIESRAGKIDSYSYNEGDTKPADPFSTKRQYFDADGLKVMTMDDYNMYINSYDESGMLTETANYYVDYNTQLWVLSGYNTYEYDELGQLIRQNSLDQDGVLLSYTVFENYENGMYSEMKNMNTSDEVTYWNHYDNTFENGLLTETVKYLVESETVSSILDKTTYTYSDGVLTGEIMYYYYNGEYTEGASITYSYNADGTISSEVSSSTYGGTVYLSEFDYVYNDYSSDYTPTNLVVEQGAETNTAVLNWTESVSSDVTGYMVIVDNLIEDVITTNTYTTSTLLSGEHTFAVVAIVNNEVSNISDIASLSLNDEGAIAPSNFRVVSVGAVNEDGSYDVEVAWDAPSTSSELTGFVVYYYSSWYYVNVDANTTSTTLNIYSWMAVGQDEYGDEIGLDVELYVSAEYTTGVSEASNSEFVNCVEGTYTDVDDFKFNTTDVYVYPNPATDNINFSDDVSVTIFSLAGRMVLASNNYVSHLDISSLNKGIYIVETKTVEGYKAITKVIVK